MVKCSGHLLESYVFKSHFIPGKPQVHSGKQNLPQTHMERRVYGDSGCEGLLGLMEQEGRGKGAQGLVSWARCCSGLRNPGISPAPVPLVEPGAAAAEISKSPCCQSHRREREKTVSSTSDLLVFCQHLLLSEASWNQWSRGGRERQFAGSSFT